MGSRSWPAPPPARRKVGRSIWSPTRRPRTRTARSSRPSRRRRQETGSTSASRTAHPVTRLVRWRPGQDADLVALSLDPDVSLLVEKGLVPKNWNTNSHRGIVSDSVVVFVVRDGNPKKIKGWGDLVEAGHPGDHAEPVHLGRRPLERDGRLRRTATCRKDRQAGDRVPVQAVQARRRCSPIAPATALQIFAQGKGDVLLTYENEAIYAEKKGVHTEYRIPKSTLLIETPVGLDQERGDQACCEGLLQVPLVVHARRRLSPIRATGRWSRAWRKGYHFFKPPRSLHDQLGEARAQRLGEGQHALLPPGEGHHGQDREVDWPVTPRSLEAPETGRLGPGRRRRRQGHGAWATSAWSCSCRWPR